MHTIQLWPPDQRRPTDLLGLSHHEGTHVDFCVAEPKGRLGLCLFPPHVNLDFGPLPFFDPGVLPLVLLPRLWLLLQPRPLLLPLRLWEVVFWVTLLLPFLELLARPEAFDFVDL